MRNVIVCKKCVMPSSRPRVVFDEGGVCNACHHAAKKQGSIDWAAREQEFLRLLDQFRSHSNSWDCVVPWSGGKDSSAIAYRLKHEYGMNPLLVTFSPLLPTEIGISNRRALIESGFDSILIQPNGLVARKLAQRFFHERGNQKVAWDAGVTAAPVRVALAYKIPLIFYAEHGESEYGGRVRSAEAEKMRDFTEVIEHLVGDDPQNWVDEVVKPGDLEVYLYPDRKDLVDSGIRSYYFGYFFPWSSFRNYEYISDKIAFETDPFGRTEGTFTNFDSLDDKTDPLYYYMQFIKFGFGRATRDASRMIQNRQLSREEAIEYILKYDAEFPGRYLKENLEYLELNEGDLHAIVDLHRNSEIWVKENCQWKLRWTIE
jgi:N-acetyl sugar amidotransferase